jgi:hypothetical protein
MGLDAGVRCRCWEEGKTTPCPFPEHVLRSDDMDMLELDLPWEGNEEMHRQFEIWRRQCCAHEDMWLAIEYISNWSGVRAFQHALRSAGGARFSTLLAQIPDLNGGRTQPEIAMLCLAELEVFSALGAFGSQVWLFDAETGSRIHNYIEAYEGVFILCGKGEPYRIGLDHNGCFVRRPSEEELFRSMKFEQINLGGDNFEFRDHSTLKRIVCRAGISSMTNPANINNPYYPRTLVVEESSDHAHEYHYIITRFEQCSRLPCNPVIRSRGSDTIGKCPSGHRLPEGAIAISHATTFAA